MDICRIDEPPLDPVADSGGATPGSHRSACWLPPSALGMDPEAERLRRRASAEGRATGPGSLDGDGREGPDERS